MTEEELAKPLRGALYLCVLTEPDSARSTWQSRFYDDLDKSLVLSDGYDSV
jgi:hypothetical protein